MILKNCKVILDHHLNFSIVFASKKTNTVVHVLAARDLLINITQTYHLVLPCIAESLKQLLMKCYEFVCVKKNNGNVSVKPNTNIKSIL